MINLNPEPGTRNLALSPKLLSVAAFALLVPDAPRPALQELPLSEGLEVLVVLRVGIGLYHLNDHAHEPESINPNKQCNWAWMSDSLR